MSPAVFHIEQAIQALRREAELLPPFSQRVVELRRDIELLRTLLRERQAAA